MCIYIYIYIYTHTHTHIKNICIYSAGEFFVGQDSTVSIATRYGLGSPEIESPFGARYSASVQTGPGAHPISYTMGTGPFRGVKRPGCGVDYPHLSSADVKEGVELYLYYPLFTFMACSRMNFTFNFYVEFLVALGTHCKNGPNLT